MTGFLEEAPGVKSSTRLYAGLIMVGVLALIGTICYVAIKNPSPEGTIAALAAPLVPLCAGLWGALRERSATAQEPPP